jgi:hypothetical protein
MKSTSEATYANYPITTFNELNPKDKFSDKSAFTIRQGPITKIHYTIGFSIDLRYHWHYLNTFSIDLLSHEIVEQVLNIPNEFKTNEEAENNIVKLLKTLNYKVITQDLTIYI